ncbi:MAG: LapA family protein [Proteobacteria bacterium]|nr:LapA family protein [Pseudomonadota bacterium]
MTPAVAFLGGCIVGALAMLPALVRQRRRIERLERMPDTSPADRLYGRLLRKELP